MHIHNRPFRRFTGSHVAAVFDTPGQFLATLDTLPGKPRTQAEMASRDSFYSSETWPTMKARAVEGDAEAARRAASLMAQIARVPYATPKRKRVASPYGRVSVGAYLASDPMPCRRHVKVPSDHAPLSVVVSLNSIGSVSADKLEKRGVAIAALVKRLVTERPVSLYLSRFSAIGDVSTCMLVKFPTAPLDSHRLAYLLSSQGFARGAGFAFHRSGQALYQQAGAGKAKDVSASNWIAFAGTDTYSQTRHCDYATDLREFLSTDLLYIPGSDPSHKEFQLMTTNPVEWINETMESLVKAK